MATFGARLKQEREQRGVTLDDISLSTKIGTRMLRALEEEHFDQLPGGIFNKGFIRAYARTLGMDEEQVIAEYLVATGATTPGINSENLANNNSDQVSGPELRAQLQARTQEENSSAANIPWGMLAVALIVIAFGFVAWDFYTRQSHRQNPQTASSPDRVGEDAHAYTSQAAPTEQSSPQTSPQSLPQTKPVDSGTPASSLNQASVSANPRAEPSSSAPVSPASSTSKPTQAATLAAGTFRVTIKAREDSWISITIDGEVTTQRTLAASAQRSVAAQKEVVIRAGNVGALDFEFNGKKLPPQGATGEAKTLTFNSQGLTLTPVQTEAPTPVP